MVSKRISSVFFIVFLVVTIIVVYSFADKKTINVSGIVKSEGKPLGRIVVNVLWGKSILTSVSTGSNGKYVVNLELQKEYRLEYSKAGFVTQTYNISTIIPQEDVDYGLYDFEGCNVEMVPMYNGLNISLFDKPTNNVKWSEDGFLEIDSKFYSSIEPKFKSVLSQVQTLRKAAFDEKMKIAEKYELEKDFSNALTSYNEAKQILPKEKLPVEKIEKVKKTLSATMSEEQAYSENINKANDYASQKKYDSAIKYYQNAMLYKPEDPAAIQKIADCEIQKNKEYSNLKNKFDSFVQTAEQHLAKNEFEEAIFSFEEAQKILPGEQYPSNMIAQTRAKTTVQKTYDKAISKADEYFKDNKDDLAIKCYKKALEIKPQETYPKDKITEIENKQTQVNQVFAEKKDEGSTKENIETKTEIETKQSDSDTNKEFDSYVKKGDELNKNLKFLDAISEYKSALKLKSDKIVQQKVDVANLQLQKQKNCQQYFTFLDEADKLLNAKKYTDAKQKYDQANSISKISVGEWAALCGRAYDKDYLTKKIQEVTKLLDTPAKVVADNKSVSKTDENTAAPKNKEKSKEVLSKATKEVLVKDENLDTQINEYFDMLSKYEKSGNVKESANIMSSIGDIYLQQNNISQALKFYEKTLIIREKEGDKKEIANVIENIAIAYYDSGKYESTIDFYEKSLQLRQEVGDKVGVVNVMNELASVNENSYRYDKAIDYYSKSLKLSEELGNNEEASTLLTNIGDIYFEQKNIDQSLIYYEKSLLLNEKLGNEDNVATSMNNIGVLYYSKGDLKKAEDYYLKSTEQFEKSGNKKAKSLSLNNLGNINFEWKKLNVALDYYQQSLKIKEELNYIVGVATSLHNIGMVYKEQNNNVKAIEYYQKSNKVADEISYKEIMSKNYLALSEVYRKEKNYEKALEAYSNYANANYVDNESENKSMLVSEMYSEKGILNKDSEISQLKNEIRKQKLLAQFEANKNKLQLEIKNMEIEQREELMQKQRVIIYTSIIALAIILIFAIFLFRLFVQKRKANVLLAFKNEEILQQKEEIIAQRDEIEVQRDYVIKQRDKIAFQNKEITDSIEYASIIQGAILPPLKYLSEILPEHFVFYKPRDIVSGDFYWANRKHDKNIIVVGDCTGHGVPGAFMSMLGISSLNEIINKKEIISSSEILNTLKQYIISSLHQTGEESKSQDGMDISICIFNNDYSKVEISGAYNPAYIIRNNEIIEHKADKMPIGISIKDDSFTSNEYELAKGDSIYMFSDGFVDQFGGLNGKKYKAPRFKEFLLSINKLNMNDQKNSLDSEFNQWKGYLAQVDDIIVMGIKI